MTNDDNKIEGTAENWESRKLGADEKYVKAVSPEEEKKVQEIIDEILSEHTTQGEL